MDGNKISSSGYCKSDFFFVSAFRSVEIKTNIYEALLSKNYLDDKPAPIFISLNRFFFNMAASPFDWCESKLFCSLFYTTKFLLLLTMKRRNSPRNSSDLLDMIWQHIATSATGWKMQSWWSSCWEQSHALPGM